VKDDQDFTDSTGNVFADLEFDDPEEELAKARLTALIGTIIERRGLSEADAASVLQMEQPELLALLEGAFGDVSTERLFRLLTALDHNVEITVTPRAPSQLRASIIVHAESEPAIIGGR
jgi:predicted XRE-type DNA-binding protein